MPYKKVSFATDIAEPDIVSLQQESANKRKMIEALRKQSGQRQTINGWGVAADFMDALAERKLSGDAEEADKQAAEKQREALAKALGGDGANIGEEGSPQQNTFAMARLLKGKAIEQVGGTSAASAYWDDAKKTSEMKNWAAMGLNPSALGSFEMKKRTADSLMNIAPGNNVIDPTTGQAIYTAPKLGEGQVYQNGQIANIPGYVGSAAQAAGATAGAKAFAEAQNKPMAVENDQGQKIWTNEANIARGAPLVSPSEADKKVGETLKVKAADDFIDSAYKATDAIKSINTINRLKDAVSSGNILSGPGADTRMVMAQIANTMSVQGKSDEERLLNTRTVIQGLAQLAINNSASIKGQGQISDFERKLLEKANSGNITDLTPPEMGKLLDIFDKSSRAVIERNNKFANEFSGDPKFEGMVRHYKVEMPAPYSPGGGGAFKIRRIRDK